MKNEQTHEEKVQRLKNVRKMLPETIDKVEYYKESLIAEGDLLSLLNKRQSSWLVLPIKKAREKMEIVSIQNSILTKQKIYESYLSRKKSYDKFLDEMTIEVAEKFEDTLEQAKLIKTNVRLLDTLKKWDDDDKSDIHKKIDFYMYLKTEISNNKKFSKR